MYKAMINEHRPHNEFLLNFYSQETQALQKRGLEEVFDKEYVLLSNINDKK